MPLTTIPAALAAVLDARAKVRHQLRHEPDPQRYAALTSELARLNREAAGLIARREAPHAS